MTRASLLLSGMLLVVAWVGTVWVAARRRLSTGGTARRLRWTALAAALVIGAALAPAVIDDSGPAWASIMLGVPVLATALPLLTRRWPRVVVALSWVGALAVTGWALLLALAGGLLLLPPALLLLASALAPATESGAVRRGASVG